MPGVCVIQICNANAYFVLCNRFLLRLIIPFCIQQPLRFFGMAMSSAICTFGFAIYVIERESDPETFTFSNCVYLALQCFVTGYAADTFGFIIPENKGAQIVCLFTTLSGLFLCSFLIGISCCISLPSPLSVHFYSKTVVIIRYVL